MTQNADVKYELFTANESRQFRQSGDASGPVPVSLTSSINGHDVDRNFSRVANLVLYYFAGFPNTTETETISVKFTMPPAICDYKIIYRFTKNFYFINLAHINI